MPIVSGVLASSGTGALSGAATGIHASVLSAYGQGSLAALAPYAAVFSASGVGAFSSTNGTPDLWSTAGAGVASWTGGAIAEAVFAAHGSGGLVGLSNVTQAGVFSSQGRGDLLSASGFDFRGGVTAKQPNSWMEIFTKPYPVVIDPPTLFWGPRPLSDRERLVKGVLTDVSAIERGSSNKRGDYTPAQLTISKDDADGELRTLLADTATRHLRYREAQYNLLSYEGRKAGLMPRPLIKGRISDVQPPLPRRGQVVVQDFVGAHQGVLPPDKMIGRFLGDEHPNLPDESKTRIYNILAGEFNDFGKAQPVGLVAPVYAGMYDISGGENPTTTPEFAAPPVIQQSGFEGAGGEKSYDYAATTVTPFGESGISNIVTIVGAASRNLSNFNYISGTFPDANGANKVRILRRETGASEFSEYIDEANYGASGEWGYDDGAAPWPSPTRDELDDPKPFTPPTTSTALQSTNFWGMMVIAAGEVTVIRNPLGSDLASIAEPKRVELPSSDEGVTWITSNSPQWPYANPWIELTNSKSETIRFSAYFLRGPVLQHHIDNKVHSTVNVCGYKGTNGKVINQASYVLYTILNEFVEKNDGVGYTNGDFGPVETFADGTPKFWSSRIVAAQDYTIRKIGTALGALGALAITEPTSLGDVFKFAAASWGMRFSTNHRGQFYWYFIDPTLAGVGRPYRERMEIKKVVNHAFDWSEVENSIRFQFHWNPALGMFRYPVRARTNDASIDAHGGSVLGLFEDPSIREMRYVNDEATAEWVIAQELALNGFPFRPVSFTTDLRGVEDHNGDPLRVTLLKEGLGVAGEELTSAVLISHSTRLYEVQHTVRMLSS